MKKTVIFIVAAMTLFAGNAGATADMDITVKYNGNVLCFNREPVIVQDKTLVQLRPIAEAMGLKISYKESAGSVVLSDDKTTVVFTQDSNKIIVNDSERTMEVPMVLRNDYTFVPVRNLAEPFGNDVAYDEESKTVTITPSEVNTMRADKSPEEEFAEKTSTEPKEISTGSGNFDFTFYYQSQPDLELEANGRGYCWVCSYAMLISDTLGKKVTPIDVAEVNIKKGYSGNFMSGHETLVSEFGCRLVPALSEDSQYYKGFNTKNKGETTLLIETDEDAFAALCEALKAHPDGILVRYEGYPHTMVAVECDENNIYFNDPGMKDGEHVTFDKTCLKNFKLSDISYIQAIEAR